MKYTTRFAFKSWGTFCRFFLVHREGISSSYPNGNIEAQDAHPPFISPQTRVQELSNRQNTHQIFIRLFGSTNSIAIFVLLRSLSRAECWQRRCFVSPASRWPSTSSKFPVYAIPATITRGVLFSTWHIITSTLQFTGDQTIPWRLGSRCQ